MNAKDQKALLQALQARFESNRSRHAGVSWTDVLAKLDGNAVALRSLREMEATGGEPDVISHDVSFGDASRYTYCDCSTESPFGRRSCCYDRTALDSRKENKPAHAAVDSAADMGIELLNEEQYRALQRLGTFDTKTSSWIDTPSDVRALGGALFCDRRYGKVFLYHNGASSYYAARGFRGLLQV